MPGNTRRDLFSLGTLVAQRNFRMRRRHVVAAATVDARHNARSRGSKTDENDQVLESQLPTTSQIVDVNKIFVWHKGTYNYSTKNFRRECRRQSGT